MTREQQDAIILRELDPYWRGYLDALRGPTIRVPKLTGKLTVCKPEGEAFHRTEAALRGGLPRRP